MDGVILEFVLLKIDLTVQRTESVARGQEFGIRLISHSARPLEALVQGCNRFERVCVLLLRRQSSINLNDVDDWSRTSSFSTLCAFLAAALPERSTPIGTPRSSVLLLITIEERVVR